MNEKDMIDMIQKAKDFSTLFPSNNDENFNDKNAFNSDKMFQAFQLMKNMQSIASRNIDDDISEADDNTNNNYFPDLLDDSQNELFNKSHQNSAINSMKNSLPFLEPKYRRNLGMFIKMTEMQMFLEFYTLKLNDIKKNTNNSQIQKDFLCSMRSCLDEESKTKVDYIIKAFEMKSMIENLKL